MARARGGPPDTKPWVSPRAIWAVCLFNREFALQETGPGRGVDACWLLGSIQPTGPITAGPCGRRRRRFRKRWHFGNAGPDTCAACLRTGTRHECRNCGRRDRLTSDRCMTPGEALPENPTLRVNRAVPAFGAEIFESTCSTVQQHTPRYLCSTKYHTPIHGAPRAPVRRSLPSAYARNKRGENNSRRSRRCRVTAPFADPSRTAEILRSPVIFTRLLVVFGVASISRWPNPPATACASYLEDLAKSSVLL